MWHQWGMDEYESSLLLTNYLRTGVLPLSEVVTASPSLITRSRKIHDTPSTESSRQIARNLLALEYSFPEEIRRELSANTPVGRRLRRLTQEGASSAAHGST